MKQIYRISFNHQGTFMQLHAKNIAHSPELLGFLEVKDFVFPKSSKVLINPAEEKVKEEFGNISSTFIPVNMVGRIDMVPMPENDNTTVHTEEKVVQLHPKN